MWSGQFYNFIITRTSFSWWDDDDDDDVCFVKDQHANSLKQQSTERPVVLLRHIILTPGQSFSTVTLYTGCLVEKQQTPVLLSHSKHQFYLTYNVSKTEEEN